MAAGAVGATDAVASGQTASYELAVKGFESDGIWAAAN